MRECDDGRHRGGVPIAPLRKVHTSVLFLEGMDDARRRLRKRFWLGL